MRRVVLLLLMVGGIWLTACRSAAPGARTGVRVVFASGDCLCTKPDGTKVKMQKDQAVFTGDRITTGGDGYVDLELRGVFTLRVKPRSELIVNRLEFVSGGAINSEMDLRKGDMVGIYTIDDAVQADSKIEFKHESSISAVRPSDSQETVFTASAEGVYSVAEGLVITIFVIPGGIPFMLKAGQTTGAIGAPGELIKPVPTPEVVKRRLARDYEDIKKHRVSSEK